MNITVETNSLDSTYSDYQPMIFQLKGSFASVTISREDLAMEKRHELEAEGNKLSMIRKMKDKALTGALVTTGQPHRLPWPLCLWFVIECTPQPTPTP